MMYDDFSYSQAFFYKEEAYDWIKEQFENGTFDEYTAYNVVRVEAQEPGYDWAVAYKN